MGKGLEQTLLQGRLIQRAQRHMKKCSNLEKGNLPKMMPIYYGKVVCISDFKIKSKLDTLCTYQNILTINIQYIDSNV